MPLPSPTLSHQWEREPDELWWDDLDAHLAARNTEQGRQALRELIEDEHRFVDLSHSQLWYCEERVML